MQKSQKLYVLSRGDLEPGLQAAQAVHAVTDLIFKYPTESSTWRKSSNYVVILSVEDEKELLEFARKLKIKKSKMNLFREPDLDMEATALAILPGNSWKLFSELPLAMKT